ncbi:MAG: type II secretion system F family protein [Candidatus Saccharibacteria bacterium]|nr:type II secretion system F family protein [Candidatus Saccharibacteria bacterium]
MKRFDYKAKDKSTGKTIKGSIQAESERMAGKLLVEQGYIPDTIIEYGKGNIFVKASNKVRSKDRIIFTRQFSTLIAAGLPLSVSLRTIVDQTESRGMRAIVEEILASVEAGKALHEAFAQHPDIFNHVYVALIAAGEMSGTLDVALRRLADQEEKDQAMLSKIRGAMIYPAIILLVIIAVLAFLMIMVVPQVAGLYADMRKELPFLTKFLYGVTGFFGRWWWLILLLLAGGVVALLSFKKTPAGRKAWDGFKLRIPIFGKMFLKLYVSRFTRTLEMMLATGVPMIDSITIAAESTNNVVAEEEYKKAINIVKGGKPLSEALTNRRFMLPLVPQMSSIGEQSGKIDEMLGKAAQVYENELDEQIAAISTMIEPVLMVVMALLIGVVIGGTLMPIYTLVSAI